MSLTDNTGFNDVFPLDEDCSASMTYIEDVDDFQVDDSKAEHDGEAFLNACRGGNGAKLEEILRFATPDLLNCRDRNGQTGFSLACAVGKLDAMKALVQSGWIDVNQDDNEGNTPLMLAAEAGFDEAVRFLTFNLHGQVDPNAQNYAGFTALMKAALHNRVNCARILLVRGADVRITDWGRGLRADQWADTCGAKTTAAVIRNISKCTLTKEEVEEFRWIKKKNALKELYEWIECKLRKTFNLKRHEWTRNAGATYHLVANAYALHVGIGAPTTTRLCASPADEDSIIVSSVTDEDTNEGRLVITMTTKTTSQANTLRSPKSRSDSITSRRDIATEEIPTVSYTLSSPTSKVQPNGRRDYHLLQVPRRDAWTGVNKPVKTPRKRPLHGRELGVSVRPQALRTKTSAPRPEPQARRPRKRF